MTMNSAVQGVDARDAAYEYVSHWRLAAPLPAVWTALTEVEQWPRWWRYVRSVQTLRKGDADGLGALRRIAWTSRLPYGFTLDVECDQVQHHRLLRGAARGGLEGVGVWELSSDGDTLTRVRYTWRLALNTRWMRLAAPLMSPAFRWTHEGVMHAGAEGLARHLGVALIEG